MLVRRVLFLLGLLAVAVACGDASGQSVAPLATAPIGGLPAAPDTTRVMVTASGVVRTTVTLPAAARIGALVTGNRVILIGDSVMASTSQRYGGEMCAALVPLGWQAEVDAETGRFVDFGDQVLDKRLAAGWDTSVILLGNNYGDNQDVFRQYLDDMVARLSPAPVVLVTVSEFKPSQAPVNAVVLEMAAKYQNVVVLDWAAVTAADRSLTGADGLHLTPAGRAALAGQVALTLGPAPLQPGKCLSSSFRDDSAGNSNSNTATTVKKSTTTTVKKSTTTTVASPGTSVTATTTPANTGSATTSPPPTTPVATSPPPASTDAPPSTEKEPPVATPPTTA